MIALQTELYIDSRGNFYYANLSYEKHDVTKKKLTDHNGNDISNKLKDSYVVPEPFRIMDYETHGEHHKLPWQVIYHAAKIEHTLNILLEQY